MSPDLTDRHLGLRWALFSAFGGALMVIPWKLANEIGEPSHSVLLLLGVAAIANTVLVLGQRVNSVSRSWRIGRTELLIAALLAVFTLLGNWASARAIQDLSPALLNALLRVDVLFVAFLGGIFLGERVDRRFWFGAVVAVYGLYVLQNPQVDLGSAGIFGSATGMAIVAALCFSSLAIVTRRFISVIDPVRVNAARLWMAVAFWFLFNSFPVFSEIPKEQILYAGLAAVAGPFLGRLALMISARHIEARVTTRATLMTPAMTLALGFILLSDWPETYELIGGAIMIAGVAIPLLGFGRTRAPGN
jgi:drug/metabolite transporter (DMT)-like permease